MPSNVADPTELRGLKSTRSRQPGLSPATSVVSEMLGKQKAQFKYIDEKRVPAIFTISTIFLTAGLAFFYEVLARLTDSRMPDDSSTKPPLLFYALFYGTLLIGLLTVIATIVTLVQFVLHYLANGDLDNTKSNKFFWFVLLNKYKFHCGLIGAFLLFPLVAARITKYHKMVTEYAKAEKPVLPENYAWIFGMQVQYQDAVLSKAMIIVTILLVKSALLFTLEYNIRNKVYFKKNALNELKLGLLRRLNQIAGAGEDTTVDQVVDAVVLKMGRDDGSVYYTESVKVLGEEDAERLFAFGDPSGDYKISRHELTAFYRKTFEEHEALDATRTQTDSSIGSLNGAMTVLCLLIILGVLSSSNSEQLKKNSVAYFTAIISGSYIFSDVIKKFLIALAFVFFIRSFEVGDCVEIGGDVFVVQHINLLSTTFEKNNLVVSISNDKLYDQATTNFTLSESLEEKYVFKYAIDEFKGRSHSFLKSIKAYYDSHKSTFTSRPYFNDVRIIDMETVEVALVVDYQLKYQELSVVDKRRNSFLLHVQECMKSTGLPCK
ncbi:MSL4 [Enterospora canceri]|uniref:MSL4 n=1 Tax=Enterospora canceri TaxID=1081671 RepID=A0A1Y1S4U8_9MICR|nr:MSL4 [Enterospora canceri]